MDEERLQEQLEVFAAEGKEGHRLPEGKRRHSHG